MKLTPLLYSKCGGRMKVVSFIVDFEVADRIIDHLKLQFLAEKPRPSYVFEPIVPTAADENVDYS